MADKPGPRARALPLLLPLVLSWVLSACIVVPQTREVYDPACQMLTRQMTLEAAYIGGFQRCYGDGCAALLSAAGAVTLASAVVSGSIALVGNVVYWMERQSQCLRNPPAPAPVPAPVATSPPK